MTHDDAVERVEAATPPEASVIPESAPPTPARRPRRFRLALSLRTMMVLVLVSGVWMAWQVNRARATRRAIATIRQAGGFVHFNDGSSTWDDMPRFRPPKWLVDRVGEEYFFDVVSVDVLGNKDWNDRVTPVLAEFPRLQKLFFINNSVTRTLIDQLATLPEMREIIVMMVPSSGGEVDQDLGTGRLASLKKLRELTMLAGRIGVKDLEALATLPELRILNLHSDYGEPEMQVLGRFNRLESLSFRGRDSELDPRHTGRLPVESWRRLKRLDISRYALSLDEMKAIAALPDLEELVLTACETENEHLKIFAGMTGLKKLELEFCYVTPEGVASLQERLPALSIKGPRRVETKTPPSILKMLLELKSKTSRAPSPAPRVAPGGRPRS